MTSIILRCYYHADSNLSFIYIKQRHMNSFLDTTEIIYPYTLIYNFPKHLQFAFILSGLLKMYRLILSAFAR